jgi:hypothetical protein
MTRIAIESAFEPIEVDFWGVVFETRSMPRSRARKARSIGAQIEALMKSEPTDEKVAEEEEEKLITLYGELFDLKLVATGGGRRKPSVLLRQRWEEDKLTGEGLAAFLGKLMVAERQQMLDEISEFTSDPADRPT